MRLLESFDTELTADCVEVWGGEVSVGTYQLSKEGQRHGRLYRMDAEFAVRNTVDLPEAGILDMKHHPVNGRLAMAMSNGALWLDGQLSTVDSERILLSLDWSPGGDRLVCSDDGGGVHLCDAEGGVLQSWKAHDLEAWHCSFDPAEPCIYSAGDDASWAIWDWRQEQPVSRSTRHHTAGVCTVQAQDRLILTGSYDRRMFQWDRRNLRQPISSLEFGSGVWRMRWRGDRVLVAAMHDGFHILETIAGTISRLDRFPTKSLAYGCAWLDDLRVLGCSFYDHTAYLLNI